MTPEMKAAIDKAISENLTGAMAGQLKQHLQDAENLKITHERLQAEHARINEQLQAAQLRIRLQEEIDAKLQTIADREKAIYERELQLAKDTASNAVAVAKAELQGYKDVTAMVFRNIAVHNTINRRVGVPVEGHPGGNGMVGTPGFVIPTDESEHVTTTQA